MMKEEMHLKIEAYLNESLTDDQKKRFELELKSNSELQQELELFKSINSHFNKNEWQTIDEKQYTKEKKALDTYFDSEEALILKNKLRKAQRNYKSKKQNYFKYIAAIAATFLLVIALYNASNQKTLNELYVEYYDTKDFPSFVTRSTNNNTILDQAIISFQNKEFENALPLFEEYIKQNDTINPIIYSYIGIIHLQLNDIDNALLNFDKLLHSNSIDRSKALWYKSLLYLKINDSNQLKNTLTDLINSPSTFKNKEANDILKQIN